MTRWITIAAMLAALAACNTVKGAGADIESAGEGIQGAAQDVQNDL